MTNSKGGVTGNKAEPVEESAAEGMKDAVMQPADTYEGPRRDASGTLIVTKQDMSPAG